jgi:hypothetical protein
MSVWTGPPSSYYDPPDEPELPEAEGKCEECGKENWGKVEQDGDNAVARCEAKVPCSNCEGRGIIRVDEDGPVDDQADITEEERVALVLTGAKCPECEGAKEIQCEGKWSKDLSPDDDCPDEDRDRDDPPEREWEPDPKDDI